VAERRSQESARDGIGERRRVGSSRSNKVGRTAIGNASTSETEQGEAMPFERRIPSFERYARNLVRSATQGLTERQDMLDIAQVVQPQVDAMARRVGIESVRASDLLDFQASADVSSSST
jgi:hypothetical protein